MDAIMKLHEDHIATNNKDSEENETPNENPEVEDITP
jgi:hypothetical protein